MHYPLRAIEFFSGIGAFSQAARIGNLKIVGAFDQSQVANRTYEHNYGQAPSARNLDSIKSPHLPEADIWWMSPPCTPYTVRGKQRDQLDARSSSLRNLISLIPQCLPPVLLVENVSSFRNSEMCARLQSQMELTGYALQSFDLCPTQFGIPMKRPRMFIVGIRRGSGFEFAQTAPTTDTAMQPVSSFLVASGGDRWAVDEEQLSRYYDSLNIVSSSDQKAQLICFTSGYGKSVKASGSYLQEQNGMVRRFAPQEMLQLLGFNEQFEFPAELPDEVRWKLLGNSVDVRSVLFVLNQISGIKCGAESLV